MQFRRWTTHISLALVLMVSANLIVLSSSARAGNSSHFGQSRLHLESKLAPELAALDSYPTANESEEVRVIVETRAGKEQLSESVAAKGGRIRRSLPLVSGYVAEVPLSALSQIAADDDTVYISLDRKTTLLQTARYDNNLLRVTTGAENVIGNTGISNGDKDTGSYLKSISAGPNGKGITIAVLDSGIYDDDSLHEDLRAMNDPKTKRVLLHRNFVSNENVASDQLNRGYDPYGHGTHVAGIAAGSGRECLQDAAVGNFYAGIAFNANLLDLRVVGRDGSGYISDAIAAIGWMIANRDAYNIRVANFSIGAAVTQSYRTDPLCQAVERAVRSGIVCVVAAGNFGKDAAGNTVYGSILAPGNDPLAITVGATNTYGTQVRSDDAIASYSSRGPTLVDYVCKPDMVAPGTLIRSIAADQNYLTRTHKLTVYEKSGRDIYMWLSGTSMSAPVVSGTVALMLDANPSLTPAMVKSILQFTAQSLPSLSGMDPLLRMLTEGAGYLNADAAVRMAEAFKDDAGAQPNGSQLLRGDNARLNELLYSSQKSAGAFTSLIAGETITWGDNIFFSEGLAYFYTPGLHRLSVLKTAGWQVAPDFLLVNGHLLTDGSLLTDSRLLINGNLLTDSQLALEWRVLTDSRIATNGWLLGAEGLSNPSAAQSVWSSNLLDQSTLSSGSTEADGNLMSDRAALEGVMAWGDEAPGFYATTITSKKHPLFPRGKKIR